jgi:DNA-binding NarL/FixJ family response regulator
MRQDRCEDATHTRSLRAQPLSDTRAASFIERRATPLRARPTTTATISVVVADTFPIVRNAIARTLDAHTDINVADQVETPDHIAQALKHTNADVATFDIEDFATRAETNAPPAHTIELLADVRTPTVAFSAFRSDRCLQTALDAGANAVVSKREPPDQLAEAIRAAARGDRFISPTLRGRLPAPNQRLVNAEITQTPFALLTPREVEVLRHIAVGLAKKEIAQAMHLSVKTVDNHCTNLMNKLDIHDRVRLTRYAIREGLAPC